MRCPSPPSSISSISPAKGKETLTLPPSSTRPDMPGLTPSSPATAQRKHHTHQTTQQNTRNPNISTNSHSHSCPLPQIIHSSSRKADSSSVRSPRPRWHWTFCAGPIGVLTPFRFQPDCVPPLQPRPFFACFLSLSRLPFFAPLPRLSFSPFLFKGRWAEYG